MKPLLKLCEETNQLTKEMIKENSEQLRLLTELVNFPRELEKLIHQMSRNLHLVRTFFELLFGDHFFISSSKQSCWKLAKMTITLHRW